MTGSSRESSTCAQLKYMGGWFHRKLSYSTAANAVFWARAAFLGLSFVWFSILFGPDSCGIRWLAQCMWESAGVVFLTIYSVLTEVTIVFWDNNVPHWNLSRINFRSLVLSAVAIVVQPILSLALVRHTKTKCSLELVLKTTLCFCLD